MSYLSSHLTQNDLLLMERVEQALERADTEFIKKYGVEVIPLVKSLASTNKILILSSLYTSRYIPELEGRISFSGLQRILQIDEGLLTYHLKHLQRTDLVKQITAEGEIKGTYRTWALTDTGVLACERILKWSEGSITPYIPIITSRLNL